MVKESNISPISEKTILTQSIEQRNQKHPKTVPTSKKINPTHLTQYITQGLLQELIYLIKEPE